MHIVHIELYVGYIAPIADDKSQGAEADARELTRKEFRDRRHALLMPSDI